MSNEREQRRVILIYGEPNQGKTTLADKMKLKLRLEDAQVVSVDHEYVAFVRAMYPELDRENLRSVIAPHFYFELLTEHGQPAVDSWAEYAALRVEQKSRQYDPLVVEGYLLVPQFRPVQPTALHAVQQRLDDAVEVTVIEAQNGIYLVNGADEPLTADEVLQVLVPTNATRDQEK